MSPRSTARTRTATVCALLVVAALATVVAFSSVAAAGPAGMAGSGTPGDPYVVTNATQLQAINESLGDHFVLGNDIDASGTSTWNGGEGFIPIAGGGTPFSGELDGDGNVIDGLYIDRSQSGLGGDGADAALFAETGSNAVITDLGLVDADITAGDGGDGSDGVDGNSPGRGDAGSDGGDGAALVVSNAGTVNRSYVSNSSLTGGRGGDGGDGGNSTSAGTWGADGGRGGVGGSAAGLIVTNTGAVNESYANNTSTTGGTGGVGGDAGDGAGAGGGGDSGGGGDGGPAAGLVSDNSGTVNGSYVADSSVRAGDGNAGGTGGDGGSGDGRGGGAGGAAAGLVATSSDDVTDSYVLDTGIVGGDGGTGGVGGSGGGDGSGGAGGDAAGSIADNGDVLRESFVGNATITAGTAGTGDGDNGDGTPGGLVAANTGTVEDSYWDEEATGVTNSAGGSGLTTSKTTGLAAKANMTELDWTGTWVTTTGYPGLRWNTEVVVFEVAVDSTNSPVNESGTLEVDINVTNTGTVTGTQTVNLTDLDGVERDSASVSLDAWESNSSITLNWTTQAGDAGNGTVAVNSENDTASESVTVHAPANFSVTIDDTNAPVAEGEDLLVNATVENVGGANGTQDVDLLINGTVASTERLTVGGNSTAAVNFTYATSAGDSPALAVNVSSENASDTTTATVQTPANFSVAITGTNSPVTEGDALTVDVNVTNVGEATATKSVNLSDVDGAEVDSVPVTLAGGQSNTSIALNWSTAVGDAGTDSVIVASPDANNSTQVTVQTTANFSVAVTGTNSPVSAGGNLTVDVNVTNVGETAATQRVNLSDTDGTERDNVSVTLAGGASNDSITLTWDTAAAEAGTGTVTVASPNASATASVSVNDTTAPTADAGANQTLDEDVQTSFNGTATDAVGVTGYAWDFDDGNTTAGQNATHAFATPGTYTVTFNASDTAGNVGTDTLSVTVNDTTAPTADAGANRSVQEDTAVSFNGSASTDNAGVVAYNWSFGDGATTTGTAPSHTYASPGTYTVTLNVSDAAGHAANDTLVVTVRATPAGGGGGGVGGGGGGAVGGPRIIVEPIGATGGDGASPTGGSRVSIENAVADAPLSIEVGGTDEGSTPGDDVSPTAPDAGNIVVDRIDVTPLRDGHFELAVETREVVVPELQTTSADGSELSVPDLSTDALGDAGQAFVDATDRRPAGFLRVDHAFPDDDVGDVALQFRVRKSYLSVAGVAPGAVQLYREEPEGWRALPTQQVGETDEFYRFSADSPGLSRFTIGAAAPVFEVDAVRPTDVGGPVVAGETVTVAVTVSNVGSADGRFTGVLSVDGGGPVRDSVSVPTGTSRTLELHPAFRRAGTVELVLNGRAVASVDVVRAAASGDGPGPPVGEPTPADGVPTDRPAPTGSVVESTESAPAWVVFAVALGILVALVVSNTTLRRLDE